MRSRRTSFVVYFLLASTPAIAGSGIDQLPNGASQTYGRAPPPIYRPDDYGICIDRKQDSDTRLEHCDAAMKGGRDVTKIHGVIGTIYNNVGKFDLAISAFDQALAAEPDDRIALNGKCHALLLVARDIDAASHDCDSALTRDSSSAEALENQGLLQFRLNHFDAALSSFNSAIRISFKLPYSFYVRGVIKHRQGNVAEGDSDIETARALDPNVQVVLTACGITP